MGDASARAEEHDGHHGCGDTDGLPLVDDDDGIFVAVQVAALDIDAGDAVDKAVQILGVCLPPDVGHGWSGPFGERGEGEETASVGLGGANACQEAVGEERRVGDTQPALECHRVHHHVGFLRAGGSFCEGAALAGGDADVAGWFVVRVVGSGLVRGGGDVEAPACGAGEEPVELCCGGAVAEAEAAPLAGVDAFLLSRGGFVGSVGVLDRVGGEPEGETAAFCQLLQEGV